jgi:hypothetical protein
VVVVLLLALLWRGVLAPSVSTAPQAGPSQAPTSKPLAAPVGGPPSAGAAPSSTGSAPVSAAAPIQTTGPEQRLQTARAALDAGRLDEARAIVDDLRVVASGTAGLGDVVATVYLRQGRALAEAGHHDEALAAFDVALQARPDDADMRAAKQQSTLQKRWDAMEAAWGKDEDATLAAAEEIFAADPEFRDVRQKLYALLVARGNRLAESGDRAAGMAALERARVVYPAGQEAAQSLVALTPTSVQPPTAVVRPPTPAPVQAAPKPVAPVIQAPAAAPPPTTASRPTSPPPPTPVPPRPTSPPPPTPVPPRPTSLPPPTPVPPPPTAAPAQNRPTIDQTIDGPFRR